MLRVCLEDARAFVKVNLEATPSCYNFMTFHWPEPIKAEPTFYVILAKMVKIATFQAECAISGKVHFKICLLKLPDLMPKIHYLRFYNLVWLGNKCNQTPYSNKMIDPFVWRNALKFVNNGNAIISKGFKNWFCCTYSNIINWIYYKKLSFTCSI